VRYGKLGYPDNKERPSLPLWVERQLDYSGQLARHVSGRVCHILVIAVARLGTAINAANDDVGLETIRGTEAERPRPRTGVRGDGAVLCESAAAG
jgi:hypothetical protein